MKTEEVKKNDEGILLNNYLDSLSLELPEDGAFGLQEIKDFFVTYF